MTVLTTPTAISLTTLPATAPPPRLLPVLRASDAAATDGSPAPGGGSGPSSPGGGALPGSAAVSVSGAALANPTEPTEPR